MQDEPSTTGELIALYDSDRDAAWVCLDRVATRVVEQGGVTASMS